MLKAVPIPHGRSGEMKRLVLLILALVVVLASARPGIHIHTSPLVHEYHAVHSPYVYHEPIAHHAPIVQHAPVVYHAPIVHSSAIHTVPVHPPVVKYKVKTHYHVYGK
ncbi:uncharacterized protein LOC113240461 [Hyposmocoma kahamanoa]|uniref:uncharacterized protein LOC113240461 n=1 Tax=Hyposmocoma kahamanoa TaxID=1477025 RepID=UPI000E6D8AB1|nr:uncharacterized protein LOC113240461 [Hyposmocoma kahamanoa]